MSLSVDIRHGLGAFRLNATFDAPRGITVLFGRSGSGKTTVVNAVAGLLSPEHGRISSGADVLFDSDDGTDRPAHRRRVGYIFQEGRLFPHLTVAQNLRYGTWFAPKDSDGPARDDIVDLLGLAALLARRPDRLSGGEKQRVAIGRALLSRPRLLLADEPLAALDAARKEEILPYFERLRDHVDIPVLYVSHDAAEVTRLATTVVALSEGRVVRQGPAADVLSDPQVTPLGAGAAGAFLSAKVTSHDADGISAVEAGGCTLLLPGVSEPPGTELRVRIEAQDVMIATRRPEDISALNILPVTICSLRMGDGPGALVQLQLGREMILSRVTRRSIDALGLREGLDVFAVIKAVSIPRASIGHPGEPRT